MQSAASFSQVKNSPPESTENAEKNRKPFDLFEVRVLGG